MAASAVSKPFASRLKVIHEGIDVDTLGHKVVEWIKDLMSCLKDPEIEVLTYVSRGFEEYRGFPQAMQTIALLQQRRPNLHVLIVGADVVAYGARRSDGRSWGDWAKQDLHGSCSYPLVGFTADRGLSTGSCLQ